MQTSASAMPLFNPSDPAFIADPYPAYRMLRDNAPVWKSPLGMWILTRYDDIANVLKNPSFIHDYDGEISDPRNRRAVKDEPVVKNLGLSMLVRDPPDHTRLRTLVVRAFTARRVEEMRPQIQKIVDNLLDTVIPLKKMDVIEDFAHKLPVIVICDMLGIPEDERGPFLTGYRISGRSIDPTPMSMDEIKEANAGVLRTQDYFKGLFERRRSNLGNDLITALLQVRDEQDGRLSDDELCANISLLFAAGHETTANLIGNGMLALQRNPDQWAMLTADPSLAAGMVDELLRYDSSVQLTTRKASQDVAVGAHTISRGDVVLCLLGAANRDPQIYASPEQLDITRRNIRPLSFGGGIHFCLGAQLARMEAEIAFHALATRVPQLRVDDIANPEWRPTITLRRLVKLPAHW